MLPFLPEAQVLHQRPGSFPLSGSLCALLDRDLRCSWDLLAAGDTTLVVGVVAVVGTGVGTVLRTGEGFGAVLGAGVGFGLVVGAGVVSVWVWVSDAAGASERESSRWFR